MRSTAATLGAGAAVLAMAVVSGSVVGTAEAATSGATDVTFDITGLSGPLELSVPRTVRIDWATGQDNVTGMIPASSVRDRRNGSNRSVTVSASISDVTNGATTIPRAGVTYTAVDVTMGLRSTGPQTLSSVKAVAGISAHSRPDGTFVWTPTLRIDLPAGVTVGNYSATLIQSAV